MSDAVCNNWGCQVSAEMGWQSRGAVFLGAGLGRVEGRRAGWGSGPARQEQGWLVTGLASSQLTDYLRAPQPKVDPDPTQHSSVYLLRNTSCSVHEWMGGWTVHFPRWPVPLEPEPTTAGTLSVYPLPYPSAGRVVSTRRIRAK